MITLQDQPTESSIFKTYLTTKPFIWGEGLSMDIALYFTDNWSKQCESTQFIGLLGEFKH